VKFTPKGGRIQVSLERVNSHLEVIVADTGEGIPPDFLPYVFDRFRQAENATTRRHGGLGLGLAIVKQIVELHGGSVKAKSAGENQGATFLVSFPLIVLHAPEPDRRHPQSEIRPAASLQGPYLDGLKVLVVDDEPDARDIIRRFLASHHANVMVACGADEAIEIMKTFRPDVLLSDIGMPGKDGYQFIQDVRSMQTADGADVPAVALTAFVRTEDRRRALLAGYQSHLAKPVDPGELVAVVAMLAGRITKTTEKQTADQN
jgi:CheY-like chemotaxis protein